MKERLWKSNYGENFNYSSYLCENEVGQTQNKTQSKLSFLYFSAWGITWGIDFFMQ